MSFTFTFVLQLKKAKKSSSISSFKDPAISTSKAVLDLVDAIKPGTVKYALAKVRSSFGPNVQSFMRLHFQLI